ncbi:SseB family protein [Salana multivorans]
MTDQERDQNADHEREQAILDMLGQEILSGNQDYSGAATFNFGGEDAGAAFGVRDDTPVADPSNALAVILDACRLGKLPRFAFIPALLGARLAVAGVAEDGNASSFRPLALQKRTSPEGGDEGEGEGEAEPQLVIAAFTTPTIASVFKERAPVIASVTGREFITTLREGYGLTIDPGAPYSVEIAPELLDALRKDLASGAL